jgi:hypothetical protein
MIISDAHESPPSHDLHRNAHLSIGKNFRLAERKDEKKIIFSIYFEKNFVFSLESNVTGFNFVQYPNGIFRTFFDAIL